MRKILLLAISLICLMLSACSGDTNSEVPAVSTVSYRVTSGAVAPDLAWDETYTMSSSGLTFVRIGHTTTTTVNAGTWVLNSYGQNEAKLFSELAGSDVYYIVKTGQGSAQTGEIKDYTVGYATGATIEVILGDGSAYNNSSFLTTPIDNYIASTTLPTDATSRYKP